MARGEELASGRQTRPFDAVRFRKIWAMTASPYEAERKTAWKLADRFAEASGLFLSDAIKAAQLDEDKDDVYIPMTADPS